MEVVLPVNFEKKSAVVTLKLSNGNPLPGSTSTATMPSSTTATPKTPATASGYTATLQAPPTVYNNNNNNNYININKTMQVAPDPAEIARANYLLERQQMLASAGFYKVIFLFLFRLYCNGIDRYSEIGNRIIESIYYRG